MKIQQIVAHTLSIPMELRFEILPVEWQLGTAIPHGWWFSMYSNDEPVFRIVEPARFAGLSLPVNSKFLTEDLRTKIQKLVDFETKQEDSQSWRTRDRRIGKRLEKRFNEELSAHRIDVLICDRPKHWGPLSEPYNKVDPWSMRDDFLRANSLVSLETFLNKYGEFSRGTGPRPKVDHKAFSEPEANEHAISWKPVIVHPDEIWEHKNAISTALKSGAAKWFEGASAGLDGVYSRPEFPHYIHLDHLIVDALYTTITVDFLQGARFRLCKRRDCRLPFKRESRHKRDYCSQYCAHLESVRRNRRKKTGKG